MSNSYQPKAGPHPGFSDQLELKLWEIRQQLDINVECIMRDHPDPEPRILPHIIETLTGHVFDRLAELEAMIKTPASGPQFPPSLKVLDEARLNSLYYRYATGDNPDRRDVAEAIRELNCYRDFHNPPIDESSDDPAEDAEAPGYR